MGDSVVFKRIARNAGALYLVQIVSFLIPLAEIPILARSLGPTLYGQILFCQALALVASLLVEYGFNINAAQQVALARDDIKIRNAIFSQVTLAKVILSVPLVFLVFFLWLLGVFESYVNNFSLLLFVFSYFLAFGFSSMWYFQGMEKMSRPAFLDVFLRLLGLSVLYFFVRNPDDFLMALPILALPPLLNTTLTFLWCRYELGAVKWSLIGAFVQIKEGFHFFVYRSSSNLVMSSIPMFLGFTSGKNSVSEFSPPEKLVKGMTSLVMPFLSAVFPLFSRRLATHAARQSSWKVSLFVLFCIGVTALIGTILAAGLGPLVLDVMLGTQYPGTHMIYAVLLGVAPLRVMNQSIAMVFLVPAGSAKAVSYCISGFSIFGVALGSGLSILYGSVGMAAGLLGAEAILFLVMVLLVVQTIRQIKLGVDAERAE